MLEMIENYIEVVIDAYAKPIGEIVQVISIRLVDVFVVSNEEDKKKMMVMSKRTRIKRMMMLNNLLYLMNAMILNGMMKHDKMIHI